MITTLQNEDNYIIAYIEWRQVGPSGYDVLNGSHIYVADLWIHPNHRDQGLLEELISRILLLAPEAKYCYFQHRKYNYRMSRLWKREGFERLINKELQIG